MHESKLALDLTSGRYAEQTPTQDSNSEASVGEWFDVAALPDAQNPGPKLWATRQFGQQGEPTAAYQKFHRREWWSER